MGQEVVGICSPSGPCRSSKRGERWWWGGQSKRKRKREAVTDGERNRESERHQDGRKGRSGKLWRAEVSRKRFSYFGCNSFYQILFWDHHRSYHHFHKCILVNPVSP